MKPAIEVDCTPLNPKAFAQIGSELQLQRDPQIHLYQLLQITRGSRKKYANIDFHMWCDGGGDGVGVGDDDGDDHSTMVALT